MGAKRQHDKNLPPGIYRVRGRFQIQWMDHSKRQRELLKPGTSLAQAVRARERKLMEVEDGTPTQSASSRVTYDTLVAERAVALTTEHKRAKPHPAMDAYFSGRKASTITYSVLQEYVAARQADGAADATIHNELAALRNAFRRGRRANLVVRVPDFPMPTVQNVRESYFTVAELDRLLGILPTYLRGPVQFAALTGWRAGNVFDLEWEHVDFKAGTVRVPIGQTKTGEPVSIPFEHDSALAHLLREREGRKRGPYVFHKKSRPVKSYAGAWRAAMRALGPAGYGSQFDQRSGTTRPVMKRFHDLRHTFAQILTEAGVAEATVLELGGWKTPAMLRRYRIVNDAAKRQASAQRDAHVAAEREKEAKSQVIDLRRTLRAAR